MKAYCLIRKQPHYRHEAFVAGLRAVGYDVEDIPPKGRPRREDVLLIWNRYGDWEVIADRFEAAGGTVLVAENGYIGIGGGTPKLTEGPGNHYYALARHAHNGRGQWHVGGPERWNALNVSLQPWRLAGDYILVCPNRSFGMRGGVMPLDWAEQVSRRLRAVTKRPIRVRYHPGNLAAKVSLEEDLSGAAACVIWSSSCGVHALVRGVPVICEGPYWICRGASNHEELGLSWQDTWLHREPVMHALAWAQWSVEEISRGEPFRYLLSDSWQTEGIAVV